MEPPWGLLGESIVAHRRRRGNSSGASSAQLETVSSSGDGEVPPHEIGDVLCEGRGIGGDAALSKGRVSMEQDRVLRQAGIRSVDVLDRCSYEDPMLHSFRRDRDRSGRMAAVIGIRPSGILQPGILQPGILQ